MRILLGDHVYEPSTAWHVAALVLVAGSASLVEVTFILELASSRPSSTAPLMIPFVALCDGAALVGLALADLGVRWIRRQARSSSAG